MFIVIIFQKKSNANIHTLPDMTKKVASDTEGNFVT